MKNLISRQHCDRLLALAFALAVGVVLWSAPPVIADEDADSAFDSAEETTAASQVNAPDATNPSASTTGRSDAARRAPLHPSR